MNLGVIHIKAEGMMHSYAESHECLTFAVSRVPPSDARRRDGANKNREISAGRMTGEQIADAHRLADESMPESENRE